MSKKAKFELGALCKHRAAAKHNARKLLVTSVGSLKNDDGETIIYQVSFERETYVARDDSFGRVILEESELELFE